MSYDSDPVLWPFGTPPNVCTLCYPVGRSPGPVALSVSGIQVGQAWVSGDPPPPNGTWILPAFGPCVWKLTDSNFVFQHAMVSPSIVQITLLDLTPVFFRPFGTSCQTHYNSQLTDIPIFKYFGGSAILRPAQVNTTNNVPSIMDMVGIPAEAGTAVSPRPMTTKETVYVFARNRDASNIHVKVNTP